MTRQPEIHTMTDRGDAAIKLIEESGALSLEIHGVQPPGSEDRSAALAEHSITVDLDAPFYIALAYWHHERDGALGSSPEEALMRLCAEHLDGTLCHQCARPTGFDESAQGLSALFGGNICWLQWDPGSKRFVRSCVGDVLRETGNGHER